MDTLDVPCTPVVNGVPTVHFGSDFKNFDFSGLESLKNLTLEFLKCEKRFWLYLWGQPGRGKTHYSVALHRAIVALRGHSGSGSSNFTEWAPFCIAMKETLSDYSYDDYLGGMLDCETLILDDVTGKLTEFQMKILEAIVQERHSQERRLVITSNEPWERFLSLFSAHEQSRVISMTAAVCFQGPDRRVER